MIFLMAIEQFYYNMFEIFGCFVEALTFPLINSHSLAMCYLEEKFRLGYLKYV